MLIQFVLFAEQMWTMSMRTRRISGRKVQKTFWRKVSRRERELTLMQIGALTQEAGLSEWRSLNNQTRFMDDKDNFSLMCIYL